MTLRVPARERSGRRSLGRTTATLAVLVTVVCALVLFRATVAVPVRVVSASMEPTLEAGDVVLVSRDAPRLADLRRGDLVVFRSPLDGRRALKRVVGLPGDEVVILDGRLRVNGTRVAESYVDHSRIVGYYSRTFAVPADGVFVLGDNRANSIDSRDYGAVGVDDVTGRVVLSLWPIDEGIRRPHGQ